jgi:serine O-acetyltransferase
MRPFYFNKMSLRNPIVYYRLAFWLQKRGIPVLSRMITLGIRFVFACWLPPPAVIGRNCSLGYGGLGVIISGKAVLGANVEIGSGVVIGGNARQAGTPIIEDDVYIGAGAKVLGPIIIGKGSVIAANSVVLKSVPPRSVLAGIPGRVVRCDIDVADFLHHRK